MLFFRILALCGSLFVLQAAQAQKPAEWNQRRINEYAAMLDHAVYKIIAEPGLRLKDEPLPPYLARLVAPQPKEAPPVYQARVQGYVALISQLGKAIAPLHKVPQLQDASEANKRRWREIAMNSAIVTMKGDKLEGIWRTRLRIWQYSVQTPKDDQILRESQQALAKETLTTLYYVLRIRKDIGIARP